MSHLMEPVEVLRRDEAPAHFLWRSGLYVVRAVLDRWTEAEPWHEVSLGLSDTAAGCRDPMAPERPLMSEGAARRAAFRVGFAAPAAVATEPRADRPGPVSRSGSVLGVGPRSTTSPRGRTRRRVDVDDMEHQIWRVLASRGRLGPTAEFNLRRTWPGGDWSLIRPLAQVPAGG